MRENDSNEIYTVLLLVLASYDLSDAELFTDFVNAT